MRTLTFFNVLAVALTVLAFSLGMESGADWEAARTADVHLFAGLAMSVVFAAIFGILAVGCHLYYAYGGKCNGDLSQEHLIGLATLVAAFCGGYLYGFTGMPFWAASGWPHGYLTILALGLLPVMVNTNHLWWERREARRQPSPPVYEGISNVREFRPRT